MGTASVASAETRPQWLGMMAVIAVRKRHMTERPLRNKWWLRSSRNANFAPLTEARRQVLVI